jgi:hypothetical protein
VEAAAGSGAAGVSSVLGASTGAAPKINQSKFILSRADMLTCWGGGRLAGRWSSGSISGRWLGLLSRCSTSSSGSLGLGSGSAGRLLAALEDGLDLVHGVEGWSMDVSEWVSLAKLKGESCWAEDGKDEGSQLIRTNSRHDKNQRRVSSR